MNIRMVSGYNMHPDTSDGTRKNFSWARTASCQAENLWPFARQGMNQVMVFPSSVSPAKAPCFVGWSVDPWEVHLADLALQLEGGRWGHPGQCTFSLSACQPIFKILLVTFCLGNRKGLSPQQRPLLGFAFPSPVTPPSFRLFATSPWKATRLGSGNTHAAGKEGDLWRGHEPVVWN